MEYYTYAYLREDGTPYYIGKGNGNRIFDSRRCCNPPRDKSRIIFLKQNLTEEEAFKHEIYMIAVFGRKDIGTGILHNRTNGGEGVSGYKHSEEIKMKMRERNVGKNNPNYGKTHSQETKRKISKIHKGKTVSGETRKKLSESRKGKTLSEETKRKLSEIKKGENNHNYGKPLPTETKKKISKTLQGRKFTEEHRKKIAESNTGKKRSIEFRNKMKKIASKRNTGKKWWNDGQINKFCVECPGDSWSRGMIAKNKRGD